MKSLFICLVLTSILGINGVAFEFPAQHAAVSTSSAQLSGRWRVKFRFSSVGEKNLIMEVQAKGSGSFLLLDTAPEGKPVLDPQPAVWSQATSDRVNFSGDVELPIGTCCREVGTLMFKGKFNSENTISGKALFVTSTTDEEAFNGFRSMTGTFTATRVP